MCDNEFLPCPFSLGWETVHTVVCILAPSSSTYSAPSTKRTWGKEELIIIVCTSNNILKTFNMRKVNHPFIQVPNGDGHFFQTLILNKEQ